MSVSLAGTMGLQRPHQCGGQSEDGETQVCGDLPDPIGPWVVGRPVICGDGGAVGQTGGHHPRTHDPSHVRGPHEDVVSTHVELKGPLLCQLHGQPGLDMDRSLGSSGGAGGVGDYHRVFRPGAGGSSPLRGGDYLVPPQVPVVGHRGGGALDVVDHQHVVDSPGQIHRLVGGLLHGDEGAAALKPVGADHQHRLGVFEPGGDGVGRVAREDRDEYRSETGHREKSDHGLEGHRQIDGNRVSAPGPKARHCSGKTLDLLQKLAE